MISCDISQEIINDKRAIAYKNRVWFFQLDLSIDSVKLNRNEKSSYSCRYRPAGSRTNLGLVLFFTHYFKRTAPEN